MTDESADKNATQEGPSAQTGTPLQLIREKELETAGRVLAVKREAEQIVSEARRSAADIVLAAQSDGEAGALSREEEIRTRAEQEAERLRADAESRVAHVERLVAERTEAAVQFVTHVLTGVQ